MDDETRRLVLEARAGGHDAFETLVRRTEGDVFRLLARTLGDPRAAEEATQDVFVAAYQGLGGLREPGSFRAWVLGIANKVGRNYLRRRAKMNGLPTDVAAPAAANPEAAETVSRALSRISEEHRDALLMRYHEGLSLREMAERTGKTVEALKSLMFRAREAFVREVGTA